MWKWLWRVLICSAAGGAGWVIYHSIVRHGGAFSWDEASHSLRALQIADDLRSGNWLAFLFDIYRQVYWPPLHSLLCGIVFLLCGPSMIAARTLSVGLFVLTALVLFATALQLHLARKDLAATIAMILFLSSPLAVRSSAEVMLEMPGLFFLSLSVLVYIWLRARPQPPSAHLWLGVAITLTYFARTNYGVLLLMIFALAVLLEARFEGKLIFSAANAYTVLPIGIVLCLWFAYPAKIGFTLLALAGVRWGPAQTYGWEGLLFYPFVVMQVSGSIWQSAVLVIAFFAAFKYRMDPAIRFLLLLTAVQFSIAVVHHTREARLILPIIVPLVLLAGFVIAQWWDLPNAAVRRTIRFVALALCLSATITFYRVPRSLGTETYPELRARLRDLVSGRRSSLLLGSRHITPSPPLIDWQLAGEMKILPANHSGVIVDIQEYRKFARLLRTCSLPQSLKNAFDDVVMEPERPGKFRSLYAGLPAANSYPNDPRNFGEVVQTLNATHHFDQIIVLTPLENWPAESLDFFMPEIEAIGLSHTVSEDFPGSNIRLDVFCSSSG